MKKKRTLFLVGLTIIIANFLFLLFPVNLLATPPPPGPGPGIWIVTYYSEDHWECNPGGGVCCELFDCKGDPFHFE